MPVIPASQNTELGGLYIQSQPKELRETSQKKNKITTTQHNKTKPWDLASGGVLYSKP